MCVEIWTAKNVYEMLIIIGVSVICSRTTEVEIPNVIHSFVTFSIELNNTGEIELKNRNILNLNDCKNGKSHKSIIFM